MKKLFLVGFLLCGFLSVNIFAEGVPLQITEGRFFIAGNQRVDYRNAWMKTPLFSALSNLGGDYSPWTDICRSSPKSCSFGRTFTVPEYSRVYLGGCIGECHQFIYGDFTINGRTYSNAYYDGNLDFSRVTFFIPKTVKRRGTIIFRKPFSVTGHLQVCQETNIDRACPSDKILFDGDIAGKGTLTVTMGIKVLNDPGFGYPFLFQKSFDYQFEK